MDGCSNHYCYLTGTRKGMCTNSICNCLNDIPLNKRIAVQARINKLEHALTDLIDITEKHHRNPHDLDITSKYNASKTRAKELLGG